MMPIKTFAKIKKNLKLPKLDKLTKLRKNQTKTINQIKFLII